MYALRPVKDSCAPVADQMSCEGMVWLARKEAAENAKNLDALTNHPACARYQNLLDTDDEHRLIKNGLAVLQKNICVVKTPEYQQGPWSDVFGQPLAPPVAPCPRPTTACPSLLSPAPNGAPVTPLAPSGPALAPPPPGAIPPRFEAWTRRKGYRETI